MTAFRCLGRFASSRNTDHFFPQWMMLARLPIISSVHRIRGTKCAFTQRAAGHVRVEDGGDKPAARHHGYRKECAMAYVVCDPCHDCKYTDCVAVCPMECFWQDDMMLYID